MTPDIDLRVAHLPLKQARFRMARADELRRRAEREAERMQAHAEYMAALALARAKQRHLDAKVEFFLRGEPDKAPPFKHFAPLDDRFLYS